MANDPYVYPEVGTLKNKLNITDHLKLREAEANLGFVRLIDIDAVKQQEFDVQLIKDIHKHIFEDIFTWAGEFRSIPIYKREAVLDNEYSIPYSEVDNLEKDLNVLLNDLNNTKWDQMDRNTLVFTFARKMAKLWKVHPFRDGNTRTFLSFASMFAKAHGFGFDVLSFTSCLNRTYNNDEIVKHSIRDKFVLASVDDYRYLDVSLLADAFKRAMDFYDIREAQIDIFSNNDTKFSK